MQGWPCPTECDLECSPHYSATRKGVVFLLGRSPAGQCSGHRTVSVMESLGGCCALTVASFEIPAQWGQEDEH